MLLSGISLASFAAICGVNGVHQVEVIVGGPGDREIAVINRFKARCGVMRQQDQLSVPISREVLSNPAPLLNWIFGKAAEKRYRLASVDEPITNQLRHAVDHLRFN